jgi:5-formyltetrahydrofolate cyclo-ligase
VLLNFGSELNAKSELRRRLRAARDALPLGERHRLSESIWANLLRHPALRPCQRVGLYAALRSEVATDGLFAALRSLGKTVCLPRTCETPRGLVFAVSDDFADLVPGPLGIGEPSGDSVPLASIDLLVVPGLAFDRAGHRLGYGAGYYDRVLEAYTGKVVGLAYSLQLVSDVPVDRHDRSVDMIVTEHACIDAASEGGRPCPT